MRNTLLIMAVAIVIVLAIAIVKTLVVLRRVDTGWDPRITYSRLKNIADCCDEYELEYTNWPDSLDELRATTISFDSRWCTDAWNRPVLFVPYDKALRYGQVISYGRDGKSGGLGEDGDIEIRYPVDENSNWDEAQKTRLNWP